LVEVFQQFKTAYLVVGEEKVIAFPKFKFLFLFLQFLVSKASMATYKIVTAYYAITGSVKFGVHISHGCSNRRKINAFGDLMWEPM